MVESEEAKLVQKLALKDRAAWEEFARGYYRPLLAFVMLRFASTRETAEEVVQMTFVRLIKSIDTFDPERGALWTWLKTIAANEARTLMRRERRHFGEVSLSALPADAISEGLSRISSTPLPEEILARKDFRAAIQDALMTLKASYREALVMKYVDGLKVSEMAAALGCSEKAVESTLSRSREAFARAITKSVGRALPESI